jgi:uncharacterized protein YkuJ
MRKRRGAMINRIGSMKNRAGNDEKSREKWWEIEGKVMRNRKGRLKNRMKSDEK